MCDIFSQLNRRMILSDVFRSLPQVIWQKAVCGPRKEPSASHLWSRWSVPGRSPTPSPPASCWSAPTGRSHRRTPAVITHACRDPDLNSEPRSTRSTLETRNCTGCWRPASCCVVSVLFGGYLSRSLVIIYVFPHDSKQRWMLTVSSSV